MQAAAVAGHAGRVHLERRYGDEPVLIVAALVARGAARRAAAMTPPRLRVASDVDGTFTDNLAYDEAAKRITVAKVPTTPENRALGTVRGLQPALALQGREGGHVV